ncbi:Dolichyl-phosphate-mannose-protein mannosyltransferase-domain-containing protein [Halteromyces radiatus]|uniref:Dolichyl-phosphate-mannose-protein mannosyltransferase-domain-containing protein n=1 Tax=Halteromyces radiatus TaxID=101107 RepID=UPI00221E96F7|nr:Dolichyl-phosphate-mannose-protein mannosyltransferase-domain-containing protein [Halteromyces radiatus]KAI8084503.1 Dolichyl-phosphate-mannose-protein mannosyltransferase-domain-containing protein [Halteromyces radiatus]
MAHAIVTLISVFVSFFRLRHPSSAVFNEEYIGKCISHYINGTYFYDIHPPLGKLLLAYLASSVGFDGQQSAFPEIGNDYPNSVPYVSLRAMSATLNVLSTALIYGIMRSSGYSALACILPAMLYTFDNSFVAQNRLISLESSVIFFILSSIFCYIQFRRRRDRPFSITWWFWLLLTGVAMSSAASIKFIGVFVIIIIDICTTLDLWQLLHYSQGLSMTQITKQLLARIFGLIIVPTALFLFWFYLHFKLLPLSGPGDEQMTVQFQETLQGSPLVFNSIPIRYYDAVSFRFKKNGHFLHSDELSYPRTYEDGRVSSAGFLVDMIKERNEETYWRIMPTTKKNRRKKKNPYIVKSGDVIRLQHLATRRYLLAHDVASPLHATNMELTTVAPNERPQDTLFRISTGLGNVWMTQLQDVQVINVANNVALSSSTDLLPEWGLYRDEVSGNKLLNVSANIFVAHDVYGKDAYKINMKKGIKVKKLSFWKKYKELQLKMLKQRMESHPDESRPSVWPLAMVGTVYWGNDESRSQIYMTGNVAGWWLSTASILLVSMIFVILAITGKRDIYWMNKHIRRRFTRSGGFFISLWAIQYIPFYFANSASLLQDYLPAVTCGYLAVGALYQYMFIDGLDFPVVMMAAATANDDSDTLFTSNNTTIKTRKMQYSYYNGSMAVPSLKSYTVAMTVILTQLVTFVAMAPLTYGYPGLTTDQVVQRKLFSGWNLLYQN